VRASVLVPLPPHVHTRERTAAPARRKSRAHSRGGAPEARRRQRGPASQPAGGRAGGRCGQTGGA
jgi:hypothetical protein